MNLSQTALRAIELMEVLTYGQVINLLDQKFPLSRPEKSLQE